MRDVTVSIIAQDAACRICFALTMQTTGELSQSRSARTLSILRWIAFAGFVVSAMLNLAHVRGGFATKHLADITVPAWLYLSARDPRKDRPLLGRVIGASPERAALLLWSASTATEVSQRFWPHGLFSGRFDSLDIVAYAAGILPCYAYDRHLMRAGGESNVHSRRGGSA
jgi:hypothetical protein